jgi:hypothetical protein
MAAEMESPYALHNKAQITFARQTPARMGASRDGTFAFP